jgi:hypothetical protein
MAMKSVNDEILQIQPKYSTDEIMAIQREEELMEANVELLKQTIRLLWIVTELRYFVQDRKPKAIDRYEAVVGGNIVRLTKLNTSFLQNVCERKSEICFILSRCIAETSINLKYILQEGEERVKRNYIKYSLITEKELWTVIKENVAKRDGDVLNIEARMITSIERSFEASDFELDEVRSSSRWKSIASRSEKVASPNFYEVFYGLARHAIHGNWQDILFNHTTRKDQDYFLKTNWVNPRPQLMDGPIIMNIEVILLFVDKELVDDNNRELLIEKSKLLRRYHDKLVERHEQLLAKQTD